MGEVIGLSLDASFVDDIQWYWLGLLRICSGVVGDQIGEQSTQIASTCTQGTKNLGFEEFGLDEFVIWIIPGGRPI